MKSKKIKRIIERYLDDVPLVGIAVNRFCSYADFSETDALNMELCVVEAVTNSIQLPRPTRTVANDRFLLQSLGVARLGIYHRPAGMRGLCAVPAKSPAHDAAGFGRLGFDFYDCTAHFCYG